MTVETVRPTSVVSAVWSVSTVGNIDDAVSEPSAGDGLTCRKNGSSAQSQGWNCGSPVGTGTCSAAKVWLLMFAEDESDVTINEIRVRLNGSWYTTGSVATDLTTSSTWYGFTFTGSYGNMATIAPAFEVTLQGSGSSSRGHVDVGYIELTFAEGGAAVTNPAAMLTLL